MSASEPSSEHVAYGTAAPDAPVSRADFERAVRSLHLSDLELRDTVLQLAARVVALTDELTRRLDGVEPLPAAPDTPAAPSNATVEAAVDAGVAPALSAIQASDARTGSRVAIELGGDKYAIGSPPIPCAELIPLCHARCCAMTFALSTQDLDEGVIRWDYGRPYMIRQRASDGYCVHNDPDGRGCTVHAHRPGVCRSYDCRDDPRVWIDYAQRIPRPLERHLEYAAPKTFNLVERARARSAAVSRELLSIDYSFPDAAPCKGPRPG